jgi:isopentenyl diphosphate isomerase/L-lactate dehydrogenase-like FMN-dependent dehydrogenase
MFWSKDIDKTSAHLVMHRLKDNEAAFNRYKIRPRVMVNVAKIDLETEIFGVEVRTNPSKEILG